MNSCDVALWPQPTKVTIFPGIPSPSADSELGIRSNNNTLDPHTQDRATPVLPSACPVSTRTLLCKLGLALSYKPARVNTRKQRVDYNTYKPSAHLTALITIISAYKPDPGFPTPLDFYTADDRNHGGSHIGSR